MLDCFELLELPSICHSGESRNLVVVEKTPAFELVKKSIVSAMFSEHPRFILESNSDQLKNKPNGRPLFHNLFRRSDVLLGGGW